MSDSPFAALSKLRPTLVQGDAPAPAHDPASEKAKEKDVFSAKLVVRQEKKGRGGKTVTRISGLLARGDELAALASKLRKELGTGGSVQGNDIVLSGKQKQRVAQWLERAGAKRVVVA